MHDDPRQIDPIRHTHPEPLQFSLALLLALTTAVAVCCSLMFNLPAAVATPALLLITIALPAVLCTVIVYGRGYSQTFSIGAMFPAGTMLVCTSLMIVIHTISAYQNDLIEWRIFAERVGPYYRPYVGGTWVLTVVLGMTCVVVRWLLERGRRSAGDKVRDKGESPWN